MFASKNSRQFRLQLTVAITEFRKTKHRSSFTKLTGRWEQRTATMSFSSSFLKPGNMPSSPASNPLASSSSTTSNQPPATQQSIQPSTQQSNGFGTSSISSFPIMPSGPIGSGSNAATMRLREIAQKSQKLNDTIQAGSPALPKLELSLGMIREKARDMSRRAGGAGRENMQQAYIYIDMSC